MRNVYKILYVPTGSYLSVIRLSSKKIGKVKIKKIVEGLNIEDIDMAKQATTAHFLWSDLGLISYTDWKNRHLPYYENEFELVEISKTELENEKDEGFQWDFAD